MSASILAQMVRDVASALPIGFNGNDRLYGLNLFLMTAFMCLGAMMAVRGWCALWHGRGDDRLRHPVSIWRLAWLMASLAATLRCGSEAMNLWAWSLADPATTARVLIAKRWIDPLALLFTGGWMLLALLADTGMSQQLRRRPYPIAMWASLPSLRRPLAIVGLSLVAAIGVTWTR